MWQKGRLKAPWTVAPCRRRCSPVLRSATRTLALVVAQAGIRMGMDFRRPSRLVEKKGQAGLVVGLLVRSQKARRHGNRRIARKRGFRRTESCWRMVAMLARDRATKHL